MPDRRLLILIIGTVAIVMVALLITNGQKRAYNSQALSNVRQYLQYASVSTSPQPSTTGHDATDPFVNAYLIFADLPMEQRVAILDDQELRIDQLAPTARFQVLKFARSVAQPSAIPSEEDGTIRAEVRTISSTDSFGNNVKRPCEHLIVEIGGRVYDICITSA